MQQSAFYCLTKIDWIGWATAVCYGCFVPLFLAFLFAKQYVVMRESKTFIAQADVKGPEATLKLQTLEDTECFVKDRTTAKGVCQAQVQC